MFPASISGKNRLIIYFLVSYIGFGVFQPLFPVFLQEGLGFDSAETSMLVSLLPLVTIVGVPFWGIICDRIGKPNRVLCLTSFCTAGSVLLLLFSGTFPVTLGVVLLVSGFQCSLVLISDSITLSFSEREKLDYRTLRSWAAISYALSALVFGYISGSWIEAVIYFYAGTLLLGSYVAYFLPQEHERKKVGILKGIKELVFSRRLLLFWPSVICLMGPIQSFQSLVGVLYPQVEQPLTMVEASAMVGGLALIMQGSSFFCMRYSKKLLSRWGNSVLIVMAVLAAVRWVTISLLPTWITFLVAAIIQGAGAGVLLTYLLEVLKKFTPKGMDTTSVAIYYTVLASANFGWTFLNGFFSELFGGFSGALFLGMISLVGLPFFLLTLRSNSKA